jgi:kinesin family protein 18/19
MQVAGATEVLASSVSEVMTLLRIGNKNRTTEATDANEQSSRSHAVLTVVIEFKNKNTGIETELNYSKLSMIDLAGSERASATENRG